MAQTSMQKVEALLDTEGLTSECWDGCPFYREERNWVPYGSTEVPETLAYCEVPPEQADECPRLIRCEDFKS